MERTGTVPSIENGTVGVVVCDDHEMFVQGLVSLLASESRISVVGTAFTGCGCMETVRRTVPDVVLLDHHLPDEDGTRVTRRIKAEFPDTEVVIVTSIIDDEVALGAIEAGCSGFLTKDKAITDVVNVVLTVAEGDSVIPPAVLERMVSGLRGDGYGLRAGLTPRELEVLQLLADGLSTSEIAEDLVLSIHTVRGHVQSVITKLGANSRLEAVVIATRQGVVSVRQR